MKCPKCGYQSFNHLATCKKCGQDLADLAAKLGFNHVVVPSRPSAASAPDSPTSENHGRESLEDYFRSIPEPEPIETTNVQPPESPSAPASQAPEATPDRDRTQNAFAQPAPEETGDAVPFPFEEMDADSEALRLEPEEADDPLALENPFDEQDELALGLPPLKEQPARRSPPSGLEPAPSAGEDPAGAESGQRQDPAAGSDDFFFTPPAEAMDAEEEDFFFSFEELNEELSGWQNAPALPEMTRPTAEEIDIVPEPVARDLASATDPRQTAEQGANIEAPSPGELPAAVPPLEPPEEDPSEAPALKTEQALMAAADDPWPAEEDVLPAEPELPVKPEVLYEPELPAEPEFSAEPEPVAESELLAEPEVLYEPELLAEPELSAEPAEPKLARRFGALLTDLGILTVIFALFLLAGEMIHAPAPGQWFRFTADALLDLAAPYFVLLFTLFFGYFTLFHFFIGQTPGKMLRGLRVEDASGEPLSMTQAFLRSAGGLVMLLPAGLGFLTVMMDRELRGWNDRLANTRVVNKTDEDREL
jgi:uncharacterized RDD family membrane protein YckC